MNVAKQDTILHPQDKIIKKFILWAIPNSITPNQVTVLRFLMTPFVVWTILIEKFWIGAILFILAALTDAIDGAMARTRKQITEWGKMYDPLADKLLIGSTAFLLVIKHLNIYLGLAIISIEILLIANGGMRKVNGHVVQANIWGKIKMILQVVGVMLIFAFLITSTSILLTISFIVLIIAIVMGIISLFTYSI